MSQIACALALLTCDPVLLFVLTAGAAWMFDVIARPLAMPDTLADRSAVTAPGCGGGNEADMFLDKGRPRSGDE